MVTTLETILIKYPLQDIRWRAYSDGFDSYLTLFPEITKSLNGYKTIDWDKLMDPWCRMFPDQGEYRPAWTKRDLMGLITDWTLTTTVEGVKIKCTIHNA